MVLTQLLGVEEEFASVSRTYASSCSSTLGSESTSLGGSLCGNTASIVPLVGVRTVPSPTSDGDEGSWSGWGETLESTHLAPLRMSQWSQRFFCGTCNT